jgi:hypothetical protein
VTCDSAFYIVDRWTGGQVERWTVDRWTGGQVERWTGDVERGEISNLKRKEISPLSL